ncbi:hypothetical protein PO124_18525 [Bacillus licheniformis]|nr:hypothetical protein [Bacillus licheniformis]
MEGAVKIRRSILEPLDRRMGARRLGKRDETATGRSADALMM